MESTTQNLTRQMYNGHLLQGMDSLRSCPQQCPLQAFLKHLFSFFILFTLLTPKCLTDRYEISSGSREFTIQSCLTNFTLLS